jgi:hypothetical protein
MPAADGSLGPAGRAERDLIKLLRRLTREISALLAELDTKRGSAALESDRQALQTALRVRLEVTRALEERGLTDVVAIADQHALDAARAVAAQAKLDIPITAQQAIATIVRGQTADVAQVFGVAADEMRQAINAGISTGGSLADLTQQVAERLDVAFFRAQAAVDSAVMAAGRTTIVRASIDTGLPYVYLYDGPRDGKMRDFCKQLVGRAVSTGYMARLDNGMGLPVRDFCGGYNCRHFWSPMLRSEANADGIEVYE